MEDNNQEYSIWKERKATVSL